MMGASVESESRRRMMAAAVGHRIHDSVACVVPP
jgi:hypothetical protein